LIELRRRLGVTQQIMATRLGCSLQTIARWETIMEPQSAALIVLRDLAEEKKYADLAKVFAKTLERVKRTQPVVAQKAHEEQVRWAQVDVLLAEIQNIAEGLRDQGNIDGKRIYDLGNDMWQALEQIHLMSWRNK
jgi:transcriptional regulator with XRE-family HTH domain